MGVAGSTEGGSGDSRGMVQEAGDTGNGQESLWGVRYCGRAGITGGIQESRGRVTEDTEGTRELRT